MDGLVELVVDKYKRHWNESSNNWSTNVHENYQSYVCM